MKFPHILKIVKYSAKQTGIESRSIDEIRTINVYLFGARILQIPIVVKSRLGFKKGQSEDQIIKSM